MSETMQAFMTLAERLGIPVALLAFLAVAVWLALRSVGKTLLERHLKFVDSIEQSQRLGVQTQAQQENLLGQIVSTQNSLVDLTKQQLDKLDDIHEATKTLPEHVKETTQYMETGRKAMERISEIHRGQRQ